ncbi:hypothetical protein D6Z43_16250 [Pseudomonas sp. DY-1]|uniref:hypothetical protein n=1 Tax=Pseudomonas sp. DY-1 TaxID=1755504 RepID=UPI000EA9C8B2|nr:hypothetical protein [Pseudomonas sp. DY-1]AYF88625.1 hypothetical protein D6Z43_16250 [Pseudomonas sp. DY-1]
MADLSVIFPEPMAGLVDGRRVVIHPVRLGDLEAFGKSVTPLLKLIGSRDPAALAEFAELHAKDLRRALRLTTSLSRWRIWRLPAASSLQLFTLVVKVNASFFDAALVEVAKALAGAQSSSGS